MNVRSIQHPGVEVREIDLSEYFSSPAATSINNAYVMGFTQKGPIYDCSWITSQAEFIAVYGEPKTEAERYLYYAVQSILANGGNAIVSRMPYDNKQCKTYKGLSLTYGTYDGQLGVYNTVNDTASALLPLNQIKTFIGNNVKDEGLSSYIFPKFSTVEVTEQKPKGYLLWQDMTILSATVRDIEMLANPAFFRQYSLGDYGTEISETFQQESVYRYLTTEYSVDDFKLLYKGFTKFFPKETLKAFNDKDLETGLYFNFSQIEYLPQVAGGYFYNAIKIKEDNSVNSEVKASIDKFNKAFSYTTPGFVETGWGHYTAISGGNVYHPERRADLVPSAYSNEALSAYYPSFDLCKLTISDLIVNLCPTFNDVIDYGDSQPFYRGEKPNFIDYLYSCLAPNSNTQVPSSVEEITAFFDRTSAPSSLASTVVAAREIIPNMSASAMFTINGVSPSAVGVNFLAVSGLYNVVSGGPLVSGGFPSEITLSSAISSMIIPSGQTGSTDLWRAMLSEDTYGILDMVRVYNDPMFYDFNDEAIASVDAALLNDPAVGFENMVTLVSKDVELTNEQYDNLVTTNNFQCEPSGDYGEYIDSANFMIVDKLKTVTAGSQNNEGYFVTIIDPFDALKMQRLLVNPFPDQENYEEVTNMSYWGVNSNLNWGKIYDTQINTLDTLTRVKNADGVWVGEPGYGTKTNIMDSWSVPLTGTYTAESISKILMQSFRQIPITSAGSDNESCIDKCYSTHIVVAVCRTGVNPSDGKITVNIVETFFGSLFDEFDESTGASLYIGNLINQSSNYIEFYKNRYVQPKFGGAQSREPYNKTTVNQFFLKGSAELKDAAAFIGVDTDDYDVNQDFYPGENMCFNDLTEAEAYVRNRIGDPAVPPVTGKYYFRYGDQIVYKELVYDPNRANISDPFYPYLWQPITEWKKSYESFVQACAENNVYIFDKKATCLYNLYQNAYFTSFSQKESQKVIANTTGIYSPVYGVSKKVASNFILDMDRCIKFIDNVDEIPIYFVADAGLSTIAQFVDNINWDSENEKWITQSFDPDNDPDIEDHVINSFDDVATWKKVVEKLNYISESVRKDCMTIIDAPRQLTLDGQAPKLRPSAWDNNFDDEIGKKLRFISGLNSSYTAGYYNWVRTIDDFTGIAFWLPPTCKIIGNLVYLNSVNLPWLAPAGTMYGRINGIHAISHNPNGSEENQIYLKNWNYIKQYPVEGFIVEGQKTTLTRNSAFSRINVRTLFLDIERFVTNVGRNFRYKVNNQFTREQFIQTIKPKLEDYTVRQGITEYLIRCDETLNTPEVIDNQELRAIIYIKPGRLIEYIIIDAVCTKSGAVLAEVTY